MPTSTAIPDLGPAADLTASLGGIAAVVILALGTLAWRRLSHWLAEVGGDVKTTKVQTTNSHDTNLRDDITEVITKMDALTSTVGGIKTNLVKVEERQGEMHADLRETRKDLRFATEYVRDVDKRFIEHVDDERRTGGSNG